MDPFYRALIGSVVRWLMTSIGSYLVAQHVLAADQTDRLTTDVVNHAMMAAPIVVAIAWSVWQKYRSRIKFLTALEVPAGTSERKVDALVKNGAGAALSAAAVALLLGGVGFTAAGCAAHAHPPAGTYSPAGDKAFDADNLLKDLVAISQVAVNLNAQTGKLHLTDRDTALVRDFALSAGAALKDYGTGQSTLVQVRDAYFALMREISVDGRQHPQLAGALMAIGIALNQAQ
jgi:hypothetical protein